MSRYNQPTLYGSYGMNTNRHQMASRCPNAISIGRLDIPDYRLVFRGVADIEESYGDILQTVLWDITPECEVALDILEGYPHFYGKTYLDIEIDGKEHAVMLYKMNDYIRDYSEPSRFYEELLIEGYQDHDLDLSQIYDAMGYNMVPNTLDWYGRNHYNRYTY